MVKLIYSEKATKFVKSSPYFWLALNRAKVRWRFWKKFWRSQNIWTLWNHCILLWIKWQFTVVKKSIMYLPKWVINSLFEWHPLSQIGHKYCLCPLWTNEIWVFSSSIVIKLSWQMYISHCYLLFEVTFSFSWCFVDMCTLIYFFSRYIWQ